jgi:hypothetical protein
LLHRPKIEWLCYGQRSDYQCENIPSTDPLWFYAFNSNQQGHVHTGSDWRDNTTFGNGVMVKRCLTNPTEPDYPDNPGYVVDRLKANTEQCRLQPTADPGSSGASNIWQSDQQCDWVVKPHIRVNPDFVRDNPESDVCKITVIAEDGTSIIGEKVIKAKYFHQRDNPNPYDGSYIEEFYINQTSGETPKAPVSINGPWVGSWTGLGYAWWNARGSRLKVKPRTTPIYRFTGTAPAICGLITLE